MKKVSVITLQNIKNYGSMLQAYATSELLKSNGYDAEIIDYTRKDALFWNYILGYSKGNNFFLRIAKTCILLPTAIRYYFLWRSFKRKYLKLSPLKYTTNKDLSTRPPIADIYCSGSDQVWNSKWNDGILKEFFLDFAPVGINKYALASSIGMNCFADNEKNELYKLLSQYNAISVRENRAVEMLKAIGINDVTALIDPTLTVDTSFWNQLAKHEPRKKPYILIYQLGNDSRVDLFAQHMHKETKLEVVRICIRYDHFIRYGSSVLIPSFSEFLTLFANASYVITDSFHGSCFSINYNKNLWCILPNEYSGRIVDLLKLINEEGRIVSNEFSDIDVTEEINYIKVNEIILSQRKHVLDFYKQMPK